MMRSLWISKSGMEAQQTQLDHISNNLANSGTNGYKQSHAVFEDLMYQTLRQSGANSSEQTTLPTGLQVGLGVRPVATSRQFTQGSLQQTSGNLDVAINGKGFFEITLPDGRTGYTRDGAFQLDNQGRIVTNNGYLVNTNGAQVPAEATGITISADGIISAKLAGETEPQVIGRFQMSNFVNPPGLDPIGQNTYVESVASGPPQQGNPQSGSLGSLSQGFVETSNVNVVQELVQMIQTQRAYELNSKAIQTSDQMLQKLGQL
ncbi:flagellar basal-body rod protein FlgG [Aquabacterium olei]|uniref:Flagellar basal-body rod protein FlgG n=1 Tax=Aquabacterium olei TaxID=1296669 RepID=A0A2U8FPU5_9BURK|nr:flagellar basal-body rod protein FlgG [Aquabacterium olei]AWI52977.1 flagellar basal-body rod protein FlgG [Aquabacterium olei]